jgi:pimeloyl-ACP methyl ester carboxylesterase
VIERTSVRVSVGDVAPAGIATVAARVILDPSRLGERPVVLCCFPGGGMSSRYFELDGYDMAGHLAAAGFVVVLLDHPGVGDSDLPVDPWTLNPDTVAGIDAEAAGRAVAGLGLTGATVLGVGHSMGAMILAHQQARHRPYSGLVLLGHSGRGLPEALNPAELAVAGDAERIRASLVDLCRDRFGRPLALGTAGVRGMLVGPDLSPDAAAALATANAALLTLCGLAAMIPGSHTAELAAVDVPVLLGLAENDIIGPLHQAATYLTGSADVTSYILKEAFHNSNVAPNRRALWDRIAVWAATVPEAAHQAAHTAAGVACSAGHSGPPGPA